MTIPSAEVIRARQSKDRQTRMAARKLVGNVLDLFGQIVSHSEFELTVKRVIKALPPSCQPRTEELRDD